MLFLHHMAEFIGNEITYLFPGELIVTAEIMKISTILGSCVSVCLFDPVVRVAGINHYILPVNKDDPERPFRYGDTSLVCMLERMIGLGVRKSRMIAHVYGGSAMISRVSEVFQVGIKNTDLALAFLQSQQIRVKVNETGGKTGRKVVFDTSAGVICHYLLTGNQTEMG